MTRRLRILAFLLTAGLFLLAASPASAHTSTTARSGEGVIRIVTRICGSPVGWQQVAAENGITAASDYRVLLGQSLSVGCPSGTSATPSSSQTAAWLHPLPGTCRPSYGGGQFGAPRDGGSRLHKGADLGGLEGYRIGTPVRAAAAGTIIAAGTSGGAGKRIIISHGNGITTHYHHLNGYRRTSGWVTAGEVIGYLGTTGNSTGPHVHFEVRRSGVAVNPVIWMRDHGAPIGC